MPMVLTAMMVPMAMAALIRGNVLATPRVVASKMEDTARRQLILALPLMNLAGLHVWAALREWRRHGERSGASRRTLRWPRTRGVAIHEEPNRSHGGQEWRSAENLKATVSRDARRAGTSLIERSGAGECPVFWERSPLLWSCLSRWDGGRGQGRGLLALRLLRLRPAARTLASRLPCRHFRRVATNRQVFAELTQHAHANLQQFIGELFLLRKNDAIQRRGEPGRFVEAVSPEWL